MYPREILAVAHSLPLPFLTCFSICIFGLLDLLHFLCRAVAFDDKSEEKHSPCQGVMRVILLYARAGLDDSVK